MEQVWVECECAYGLLAEVNLLIVDFIFLIFLIFLILFILIVTSGNLVFLKRCLNDKLLFVSLLNVFLVEWSFRLRLVYAVQEAIVSVCEAEIPFNLSFAGTLNANCLSLPEAIGTGVTLV